MPGIDMKPIDVGVAKLRYGDKVIVTLKDGRKFRGVFDDFEEADETWDGFPAVCIDEWPEGVASRSLSLPDIATIEVIG